MMRSSKDLGELATALAAAQAKFGVIAKSSTNPFFKSKYAPLPEVVKAATPILTELGLSVSQHPTYTADGSDALSTWLLHSSGQRIVSTMKIHPVKNDPQAQGSALTYARRYSYMAILGLVADEDDDAERAMTQYRQDSPEHKKVMEELRASMTLVGLTGAKASEFSTKVLGYPAPRSTQDARKLLEAIEKESEQNGGPF